MFAFTNINNIVPTTGEYDYKKLPITYNTSGKLDFFQLHVPYVLQFETTHPDLEEGAHIFTTLSPNASFYSSLNRKDREAVIKNRHQHIQDYFELIYVLDGEFYQCIEHQRHLYTPGCCCLFNRNVSHYEEFSTDFRAVILAMSYDFVYDLFRPEQTNYFLAELKRTPSILEQFLQAKFHNNDTTQKGYLDFIPQKDSDWLEKNIHDIFEQLAKQTLNPEIGSSFLIKYLFYKMIHLLSTPEYYTNTPIQLGTETETTLFEQITVMMEATNGRITRNELARDFHYSGDYINKIVKKFTGLSIFDYGMTFCMDAAVDLLIETKMSISEIAVKLNFNNRAHFYRLFEANYGITPRKYREQYRNSN